MSDSHRDSNDKLAPPPGAYKDFVSRYPDLGKAWKSIREAEQDGPLGERERRLLKLAVAMGAMRQGVVSSGVRKALAAGITLTEIEQLVALTASTVGLPSAVALHGWVRDAATR
ncbi:MAG: carboxymuconolactone decarboxylase family protein [Thermoanaerobaculia bacterium]|nr:carboxymuconolactone decarboxylase family protein [Thermoanaerobaculia bacterium]